MTQFNNRISKPKMATLSPLITDKTKLFLSSKNGSLSVADIAQMMEIDLTMMGDSPAFRRRFIKALNATETFWRTKGNC